MSNRKRWASVGNTIRKTLEILNMSNKPIADDDWPAWVPEGAWYARDKDGRAFLYESEPIVTDIYDFWCRLEGGTCCIEDWLFPDFPHPNKDMHWTETLCQKPRSKQS